MRGTGATVSRAVCGVNSWRWSRAKLLNTVGWLSVKQLIVYHTVLQTHKTLKTGNPRPLYQSLSTNYPYMTRMAAMGRIRHDFNFSTHKTFKYRAMQCYNSVPRSILSGSTPAVKAKLKKWVKESIPID